MAIKNYGEENCWGMRGENFCPQLAGLQEWGDAGVAAGTYGGERADEAD